MISVIMFGASDVTLMTIVLMSREDSPKQPHKER